MTKEIVTKQEEHKQFENEEQLLDYLINELNKDEKTINMIKKRIVNYGFDSVKNYSFRDTVYGKNNKEKVIIYCFIHEKDFEINPHNFLNGYSCKKCANEKLSILKTKPLEQFIEEITPLLGDNYYFIKEELKEHYKNNSKPIPLHCKKHGMFWIRPNNFLGGQGCKDCGVERRATLKRIPLHKLIKNITPLLGDNYYFIEGELEEHYKNTNIKIPFHCRKHGEFWVKPYEFLKGRGCPCCASSKGNKSIYQYLDELSLNYTPEFPLTKGRNPLRLDALVTIHGLKVGIEYDGEQHFRPVDFSGKLTEEEKLKVFNKIVERDKKKNKLCEEQNIILIRIPFNGSNKLEDIRKNVYDTLDKELKNI